MENYAIDIYLYVALVFCLFICFNIKSIHCFCLYVLSVCLFLFVCLFVCLNIYLYIDLVCLFVCR